MENGSAGAASPADDDSQDATKKNATAKRKANGDGTVRAKRNRYISIACNECKRRKIKCNGETPCLRCGNLSLECIYAPNCCSNGFRESEEYTAMNRQLTSLQEQIDTLATSLDAVQRKQNGMPSMIHTAGTTPLESMARESPTAPARARHPLYSGSAGASYDFDIAAAAGAQPTSMSHTGLNPDDGPDGPKHVDRDPLIDMSSEEALRLCSVYEEEIGSIHPMLNMEALMAKVKTFWSFMESMRRVGFLQKGVEEGDSFMDGETLILKLVLATSCLIDGSVSSELGRAIFANIRRVIPQSSSMEQPVSIRLIKIWVLLAQYHFYNDNEVQAYRLIGLAARGCFEIGLHRSDILRRLSTDVEETKWAVRLFWVIYYLDRRYSFGTGMPFAMQDADIDPQLPKADDGVPFLQLMVSFGRISSKVWTSVAGFANENIDLRKNEMGFLDYSIQQWQSSIPEALRYLPSDGYQDSNSLLTMRQRRLQLLLHLYANSSRIQLYRPVLYSLTSIMEDRGYAQTVVEIAKDTIRTLSQIHQASDMTKSNHISTNYFLIGALAVLLLAVAHAPLEFSQRVREEFYMALDLVRHYSSNSFISRRLWNTIKGLKDLSAKFGLATGPAVFDGTDHNSVMDADGVYGSSANAPINGQQMSFELTNLFEAAGSYPTLMQGQDGLRSGGLMSSHGGLHMDSFSLAGGNEEDFLRIMKECF